MLVLSRKIEEGIRIGDTIEIKILDVFSTDNSGSRKSKVASIGINAPREISILRKELAETRRENEAAQQTARDLTGAHLSGLLKKKRTLALAEPGKAARMSKSGAKGGPDTKESNAKP